MTTTMATFKTDHIATRLTERSDEADLHPGDPHASSRLANHLSDTAGPCAVRPYLDVRDACIALTALCDVGRLQVAEDVFSSGKTAPRIILEN